MSEATAFVCVFTVYEYNIQMLKLVLFITES